VRAVTGPRVQLLCVDASPRLVVFGSSIGSVYVFERRTSDGDAFDDDDADATSATRVSDHFKSPPLPEEGELRFLERFMVETHAGGSASRPVTRLRVNERRTRCALAFDDGEVVVVAFADPLKSLQTATSSDDTPSSGRYEAGIPKGHKGANVTSMAWSPSGDALISGDDAGAVSVVYLEGKSAGAHVVRFDAPVVQTSFLDVDGGAALVSTTTQLFFAAPRERVQEDAHRREAARRGVRRERAWMDARGGARGDARATRRGGG
jgi:WD40 repeat protein